MNPADPLTGLLAEIRACRACLDQPRGKPLPHQPRPIIRASASARIVICGQAPGTRVHASGVPFTDPSGDRLRDWMGVTPDEFDWMIDWLLLGDVQGLRHCSFSFSQLAANAL